MQSCPFLINNYVIYGKSVNEFYREISASEEFYFTHLYGCRSPAPQWMLLLRSDEYPNKSTLQPAWWSLYHLPQWTLFTLYWYYQEGAAQLLFVQHSNSMADIAERVDYTSTNCTLRGDELHRVTRPFSSTTPLVAMYAAYPIKFTNWQSLLILILTCNPIEDQMSIIWNGWDEKQVSVAASQRTLSDPYFLFGSIVWYPNSQGSVRKLHGQNCLRYQPRT